MALTGDLGSGKTTFVQGLAKGLGIVQRIISPTFILIRKYEIGERQSVARSRSKPVTPRLPEIATFYHIDLYRLEGNVEDELVILGFRDIVNDPKNIIAVEWAEKAKGAIPDFASWVSFEAINEGVRKVVVENFQFKVG